MESRVMDTLAKKTEKVKVLDQSFNSLRNRGESGSKVKPPKVPVKLVIKKEPRGKENLIEEEPIIDDDEDEEPDEAELKRRKARDAELNETQRIVKEAGEKERADKEAYATLKSKMLLFPKWTLKKIQHDVVELPSQYWLDPIASFDRQNSQDSQLDLPITPKAFRFRAFVKVANSPFTDSSVDQLLFSIYLKHMNPHFPNVKFKVVRGSACQAYEFTLFDLPCLNPNDWIVLYNILLREKEKYELVMSHLQLMIKSYIQEVGSMDVDIITVLKKNSTVVPKEALKDFEKLKEGKIYKEGWFVVISPENEQKLAFASLTSISKTNIYTTLPVWNLYWT
ncbi:unnamed protein product [Lactuca saligna]|uniref:Uncharacterized protein n=1 Tax=Lactuca saligna TaxID=75948 RepID=A0AA35ZKM0_LACSI|nr:unnamed protein product [Lactuca saligna]